MNKRDSCATLTFSPESWAIIREQFARKIEKWAILRNVVTHEYLDIRWNAIREFLTESRPLLDDVQRTVREAVDGAKG